MDLQKTRKQFPILKQKVNSFPLVYLDSAATSQKPQVVINAISKYYEEYNSNTHRSIHTLGDKATQAYEDARERVARFINAEPEEIVFVRNSNEGVNVVAGGLVDLFEKWKGNKGKKGNQGNDDRITILTTIAEHHANFVPWLRLQKEGKAKMEFIPINDEGELDLEWLKKFIKNFKGKKLLVAVAHVSNVLGVVNPICEIREIVGNQGLLLIDAAQSVAHTTLDVKKIDCDFLVFSGHKVFGPTGTSVLFGKKELLEKLPPFLVGSAMIAEVTTRDFALAEIPTKFEAGTPDIAGAIGLGEAVEWLGRIRESGGIKEIQKQEEKLLKIAIEGLEKIKEVHIIGSHDAKKKSGLVAFYIDKIHPHDISAILDSKGIAIRAGHHCAMPLHTYLGINASIRMSLSIFNTEEEVVYFLKVLKESVDYLKQ